jgi:hypothetical protein
LAAAASWKFSDSWASNLTAVTAAAAAIFTGISDKVSGLFSTGELTGFSVGSTVFLLVAAVAPLAYAACQSRPARTNNKTEPRGTVFGLALSTWLTTTAVLGALSLVGLIMHGTTKVNDTIENIAWAGLAAVAILMIVYVLQSVGWLLANAGNAKSTVAEEQKTLGVAPSAGHPGLVRANGQRTMSVL